MKSKNFIIIFLAVMLTSVTIASVGGFSTISEYFDSLTFDVNDEIQRNTIIEGELSGADEVRSDILNAKFAAFNKKLDLAAASSSLACNDIYYNSSLCGSSNDCQPIAWDFETNSEETSKPSGYCVDACEGGKEFLKPEGQFLSAIKSLNDVSQAICQCPYGSLAESGHPECYGTNAYVGTQAACQTISVESVCNNVGKANGYFSQANIADQNNGLTDTALTCAWNGSSCDAANAAVVCENITDDLVCEQEASCYFADTGSDPNTGDIIYSCATINSCEDIMTDVSTQSGAGNFCGEGDKVDSSGTACFDDPNAFGTCIYQAASCDELDDMSCDGAIVASGDTCIFNNNDFICEAE